MIETTEDVMIETTEDVMIEMKEDVTIDMKKNKGKLYLLKQNHNLFILYNAYQITLALLKSYSL